MSTWNWSMLDRTLALMTASIAFGSTAVYLSGNVEGTTNLLAVTAMAYALVALLFLVIEVGEMSYNAIQWLRRWRESNNGVDTV